MKHKTNGKIAPQDETLGLYYSIYSVQLVRQEREIVMLLLHKDADKDTFPRELSSAEISVKR